jgi:hypothetical protein
MSRRIGLTMVPINGSKGQQFLQARLRAFAAGSPQLGADG